MDKETLEKYEPKLYRLFSNSRKNNRLCGAYLLYGPKNSPLKETALYLAQSLSCENDIFACKQCNSCKRFESGIRPDFLMIDGQNDMIKKGDIQNLEKKFSLSTYEKGHSLCYVINKIENINNEAANALLKFLEEPKVGQVAFLTTNNLNKVLPTILSRSTTIRVDPINQKELSKKLQETEIFLDEEKKKTKPIHLSATQAYILSLNYASIDEIKEALINEPNILDGISAGEAFINDYCINYRTACFTLLKETTILKESKCYNWMYLTIQTVFEEVLIDEIDEDNPFSENIKDLSKNTPEIKNGLKVIKEILTHKNLNYNPTLTSARFLTSLQIERRKQ